MKRRTPSHYLRPNDAVRTPRRLLCFDTEAHVEEDESGTRQRFRCAVSSFNERPALGEPWGETEWSSFDNTAELWAWHFSHLSRQVTTWAYAHNLTYDLVLSGGLRYLLDEGFTCTSFGAARDATWMRWRNGRYRLILADLGAWLPAPLERIGEWMELPKGTMPAPDAAEAEWRRYCRRDVAIVRAAVVKLVDWVERQNLGSWALTGASQAWKAWRHHFMPRRILVQREEHVNAVEERAYFGGRNECYRWGELEGGPWHSVDLQAAYCHVLATEHLPVGPARWRMHLTPDTLDSIGSSRGVLAECDVTTDVPVVPTRIRTGVVWPVGSFRTVLAQPEIEAAVEAGAQVTIGRALEYDLAPITTDFAGWVLNGLYSDQVDWHPLIRQLLKRWSRDLAGKLGQRHRSWESYGTFDESHLGSEPVLIDGEARAVDGWWLGHELFLRGSEGLGENALPAAAAWVTSTVRARLWRLGEWIGWDHVVYVDTDELVVSHDVWGRVEELLRPGEPGQLVEKDRWSELCLRLPKDYEADGVPRIKGVPPKSVRLGPRRWLLHTWPGLAGQLSEKDNPGFVTKYRVTQVDGWYRRGWVTEGGRIVPLELAHDDGVQVVVPFAMSRWHEAGMRLEAAAYPAGGGPGPA